MKRSLKLLLILAVLMTACLGEIEKYSPIPEVWFKEYRYYDSTLVIGFKDGDGDIGWEAGSQITEDSNVKGNLFFEYHLLSGFDTIKVEDDSIDFTIPYLETPSGNNKTLQGDLEVDISQDFLINPEPIDSFFIRFYLIDRAFNMSNIDTTPVLYPYFPDRI